MKKELQCPKIYEEGEYVGYGGNQEWFESKWAKKAGCASVSANDIFIYYTKKQETFNKQEYLSYMESMYRRMTPRCMGFPYAYLYAKRLMKVLHQNAILVTYQVHRNPTYRETIAILKKAISSENPLGLLILKHRNPILKDDVWHWVTIFGFDESSNSIEIILSDCGERKVVEASILFEDHKDNYYKLVYFEKQISIQ